MQIKNEYLLNACVSEKVPYIKTSSQIKYLPSQPQVLSISALVQPGLDQLCFTNEDELCVLI